MGPKRVRGAAKKSQRGTGRGQVAERPRSPTPPPAEDEAMLVQEPEQPHSAGDDIPDITSVPAAAARKKRTNKPYYYTTLTEAKKEEIIDWLKDNPSIYSKRMSNYKDSVTKDKLWEDKAVDMGLEVAALKTFYKSNRTQMSRLKRTVGKSGEGAETVEDLSATDKWVWEKFFFLKDHIETVERRNVVSIHKGTGRGTPTPTTATATGPAVAPPTAVLIQSDSGSESHSQSTDPPSRRLSTESVDLKRSLLEFMSGKKGGPSSFARHIDEGLAQLPGDIQRATELKLMGVLHEGQRQAEERQGMASSTQQQQQVGPIQPIQPIVHSYQASSTSRQYPPRLVSQSQQWQPPPSQWSTHQMPGQQDTSVWDSQDSHYMTTQYPTLYPQPSPQPAMSSTTNILDLDTGSTRAMPRIARFSPSPTPGTSSQGYTTAAAAAGKTTDSLNSSLNLSDFVNTAAITNMPPSPMSPLATPQAPTVDDDTTKI